MATSKGLTKKHSALQKEHYKSHPHRLKKNKLARLRRHLARCIRKANRRRTLLRNPKCSLPPIQIDQQALRVYKTLGGSVDSLPKEVL